MVIFGIIAFILGLILLLVPAMWMPDDESLKDYSYTTDPTFLYYRMARFCGVVFTLAGVLFMIAFPRF